LIVINFFVFLKQLIILIVLLCVNFYFVFLIQISFVNSKFTKHEFVLIQNLNSVSVHNI